VTAEGGERSLVMRGEGRVEGYYWEDEGLMLYVGESVRVVLYAYLGEGRSCFGVFVVMAWQLIIPISSLHTHILHFQL
jgi:hypothetical protein